MKFNKIAALLLLSGLFAACSDDDSWNGTDATVSMAETEISVKENKGIFTIPVSVDGKLDGAVRVTVEVQETGENPAMDDIHYYVTSKTIIIPADANSGNIEISTVDDPDINDPRTFTVTIKEVIGAEMGNNNTTTVTLRDNDSAFYEKLQGAWKMTGTSPYSGPLSWDVNIIGHEEGESGYDEVLYVTNMMAYPGSQATLLYKFDKASQKITLSFALGTLFATNLPFQEGAMDAYLGTVDGQYMVLEGTIDGECSSDFNTITFQPNPLYFFLAPAGTTQLSGSLWDAIGGIVMTRK